MKKLLLLLLIFSFTSLTPNPALAQTACDSSSCTDSDPGKHLVCVSEILSKCEDQLHGVQKQEKTLKSQLSVIDGQSKVTTLKIEETNLKIEKLKREISDLSGRIDRIGVTLDSLSEILLRRIVQTYKYSNAISTIDLLFSSHGFADLIERLKYIQVAQAYDKKKLYELQATKLAYNDQREDKETRQAEAEKLNNELEAYKEQLEQQKKDKDELLRITKNDEARYQAIIAQLQAEITSIAQAISNVGAKIGPVSKGEIIAAMGSTGCSTGPHLHFEVFENAKVEGGRVVGNRTNPHNYLDNGKLGSPLSGFPGGDWVITTGYGATYAVFGFDSIHSGLDIAPKGGGGLGRPIYAAESGIAYSTQAPCNYNIAGGSSVGKGVVVDHQNGLVTLYWHIL